MDDDTRKAIALWKLGVLGPLATARLEYGDCTMYFEEAAGRLHERPDGRIVRLAPSTIRDWFYHYRHGGFAALMPQERSDRGHTRAIRPEVQDLILRAKQERPRRAIRRIIQMLERAHVVEKGELAHSTVHRLLATHGVSSQPPRGPDVERRSFLPEHAGDLWIGDSMHGPLVIAPDRRLRKSYMLTQLDAATRFVPHSYFALSEDAPDHEYGFKQAVLKHGPPRAYYVDLGAAFTAGSIKIICAEITTRLLHTARKDCEAKGGIERFHRRWREEVGDELPRQPLPIEELNAKHWAWLSAEYHVRKHSTTGRAPLEHWLAEAEYLRTLPRGLNLDEVFLHREKRTVRKDGTVRFWGRFLEVRSELVGRKIELRFDPHEKDALPRVFVAGRFVCDTVLLDRLKNASRRRRRVKGEPPPMLEPTGLDPLGLIEDEHYRRVRPVGGEPEKED